MTATHPARYSKPIVELFVELLGERRGRVLDPFAGEGRALGALTGGGIRTVRGLELERPWAEQSEHVEQGDATCMRFAPRSFNFIVTSPAYGNRYADHHRATDACKACKGRGETRTARGAPLITCDNCGGTGLSMRRSYTHDIRRLTGDPDYELAPTNAGLYEFHTAQYQRLHAMAWFECTRVTTPDAEFILNVSNFIRKGEEVDVLGWHLHLLGVLGWKETARHEVRTQRMGKGANGKARTACEYVVQLGKVAA